MAAGVSASRGKCRINWYERGERKWETLDIPFTPTGIKKAAKVREKLIREGNVSDPRSSGRMPTFQQMAQLRLDSARLSPETRRTQKAYLNKHWNHLFNMRVDAINYDDLLPMLKKDLAPKTLKHILSAGSSVLKLAIKAGHREDNPVLSLLEEVKVPQRQVDPFTREERSQILEYLSDPDVHLFYAIRFYCGLRPSEVLPLLWQDYREGYLNITKVRVRGNDASITKNHVERKVPVHPVVRDLLKSHTRNINNHLINNEHGNPFQSADKLSKKFTRALRVLGIRYRSPYNVRHTCATMMLEAGMKPAYCAKVLGHTQEMFFRRYSDFLDQDEANRQNAIWEQMA